jgi:hypothetical protein
VATWPLAGRRSRSGRSTHAEPEATRNEEAVTSTWRRLCGSIAGGEADDVVIGSIAWGARATVIGSGPSSPTAQQSMEPRAVASKQERPASSYASKQQQRASTARQAIAVACMQQGSGKVMQQR